MEQDIRIAMIAQNVETGIAGIEEALHADEMEHAQKLSVGFILNTALTADLTFRSCIGTGNESRSTESAKAKTESRNASAPQCAARKDPRCVESNNRRSRYRTCSRLASAGGTYFTNLKIHIHDLCSRA
jgi:hypothetical protein